MLCPNLSNVNADIVNRLYDALSHNRKVGKMELPRSSRNLEGCHILIFVESPIVALELELALLAEQATVSICHCSAEFANALGMSKVDLAILDNTSSVNSSEELSDQLAEKQIPTIEFVWSHPAECSGSAKTNTLQLQIPFNNSRVCSVARHLLNQQAKRDIAAHNAVQEICIACTALR
jgi:DNA-binding NtrC family response regulator